MKVKFLVPKIDRSRWSKYFSNKMKSFKLQTNSMNNIGVEIYTPQMINEITNGKSIPSFDRFLTFCRFFDTTPDNFLYPNPEWIECEIEDISKFSILGKMNDTYYIAPSKACSLFRRQVLHQKGFFYDITELEKEPDPLIFSDFHIENTSSYQSIQRLPSLDARKTATKIFQLLDDYGISRKNYKILLGICSNSVTNIKNGRNEWTKSHIYKLSWILDKPFEDLLVIKYHIQKKDHHKKNVYGYVDKMNSFDPVTFLELLEDNLFIN